MNRGGRGEELLFHSLTERIIGAAIEVHDQLGPGLLESTYSACLAYELVQRSLRVDREKTLPVRYKGVLINVGYRLDLVVEDRIVLELKAVERLDRVHQSQLLTYLKLSRYPVGLLINFNESSLRNGIRRFALTKQS